MSFDAFDLLQRLVQRDAAIGQLPHRSQNLHDPAFTDEVELDPPPKACSSCCMEAVPTNKYQQQKQNSLRNWLARHGKTLYYQVYRIQSSSILVSWFQLLMPLHATAVNPPGQRTFESLRLQSRCRLHPPGDPKEKNDEDSTGANCGCPCRNQGCITWV